MPKNLKSVLQYTEKPARKHHEYLGNTPDEQKIVKQVRDLVQFMRDYNGNKDDVFKASNIKRVEKPIQPGDDEERYANWNGYVKNVDPDAGAPDASGYGFGGTKPHHKEETELHELTGQRLNNYYRKAIDNITSGKDKHKEKNRRKGMDTAVKKIFGAHGLTQKAKVDANPPHYKAQKD